MLSHQTMGILRPARLALSRRRRHGRRSVEMMIPHPAPRPASLSSVNSGLSGGLYYFSTRDTTRKPLLPRQTKDVPLMMEIGRLARLRAGQAAALTCPRHIVLSRLLESARELSQTEAPPAGRRFWLPKLYTKAAFSNGPSCYYWGTDCSGKEFPAIDLIAAELKHQPPAHRAQTDGPGPSKVLQPGRVPGKLQAAARPDPCGRGHSLRAGKALRDHDG